MMKIDDMKRRKKELGYTNADVAERSGVPLGTVQKVFSGATPNPRVDTMEALEMALKEPLPYEYSVDEAYMSMIKEELPEYKSSPPQNENTAEKVEAKKMEHWGTELKPSERWPRQGQYTIEDYYAIPDDIRVELIDGYIYDMSCPSREHQRVLGELFMQFYNCVEEHGTECELLFAPCDVKLDADNKTMVQPDLFIYCQENPNEKRIEVIPDLVVEILSPSTREKDCTIKLRKYLKAGVKEYWIVDPKYKRVLVHMFEEDVLPTQYSFDDTIPVGISGGKCSIDFKAINKKLDRRKIG